MPLVDCRKFFQSEEKAGSLSIRNACLKCGRTREAHESKVVEEKQILPDYIEAEEYLEKIGAKGSQFFELGRNLLAGYIEWRRKYGQ